MNETYLEFCFQLQPAEMELASDRFFDLGALGVEELDPGRIKVYFPIGIEGLEQQLVNLAKNLPQAQLLLDSREEKPILNWQENWKEHFKPLHIGRRIWVRPPWEEQRPDLLEVVIHPGMGFGTGYHESTRLALEALEDLAAQGQLGKVLDVGAGSGILTIAALKLGATEVVACEIDPDSLAEVPHNLALSGLEAWKVDCLLGGPALVQGEVDSLLANITGDVHMELAADYLRLCRGRLMLSGVLPEWVEPIKTRLAPAFRLVWQKELKSWQALVLERVLP